MIYAVSYPNSRYGHLMPAEDSFLHTVTTFGVSDGITRDPITHLTLATHTIEELLAYYPNPSGAAWAAELFCTTFVQEMKSNLSIKHAFLDANKAIHKLNQKHIKGVDYLQNDYFGCVASGGVMRDRVLRWGVIGDCGIIVFSKKGEMRFQTPNSMAAFENAVRQGNITFKWETDEGRRCVRSQYRNRPDQLIDGECVSYGALTGEPSAESFIYSGELEIETGDLVLFYSDGFEPIVRHPKFWEEVGRYSGDFFDSLKSFNQTLITENQPKFGKERTLIAMRVD